MQSTRRGSFSVHRSEKTPGTITINQAGVTKGVFTTNQSSNATIELTDSNSSYSAGTGISISGTIINNSGVIGVSTGSTNGTISVNTNGTSANVAVNGLGSAAYTASSDYDAAGAANSVQTNLNEEIERAKAAEAKALEDAKAYVDSAVISVINASY